jgi:SAM-dependent methyltransferase
MLPSSLGARTRVEQCPEYTRPKSAGLEIARSSFSQLPGIQNCSHKECSTRPSIVRNAPPAGDSDRSNLGSARYLAAETAVDEFWASGEQAASAVDATLQRCQFQIDATAICVEYGCGVGRVTIPLSHRFSHVHAYDISENHLKIAQARSHELKRKNITFHLRSEDVTNALQKYDVFYSALVFQHNPPPTIMELIRSSLRALKQDGIAIFQLVTYELGYKFRLHQYLAAPQILDMEIRTVPQPAVFALIAAEKCSVLEVPESNVARPDQRLPNIFVVRKAGASSSVIRRRHRDRRG